MNALSRDFARILARDLDKLAGQLEAYPSEGSIWRRLGDTRNSAGTLALHLVGNLEHYVGAVLGGLPYVRDRDAEFGGREVPRAELLQRVARCRDHVAATLEALPDGVLPEPYPGELPAHLAGASTHLFLIHLTAHFGWHLGQVDYHRRISSVVP